MFDIIKHDDGNKKDGIARDVTKANYVQNEPFYEGNKVKKRAEWHLHGHPFIIPPYIC